MKFAPVLFLLVSLLPLAACTGHGNLYNLSTGEKTVVAYSYHGSGRGKISGTFASGETVSGEYSIVSGGSIGWGSIYGAVYAPNVAATGNANSISVRQGGKNEGSAILTGSKGTIITCEFAVGTLSGHGFGGCQNNSGELYRLIF